MTGRTKVIVGLVAVGVTAGGLVGLRHWLTPAVPPAPALAEGPRAAGSVDPERAAKLAELRDKAKTRSSQEERVAAAIETILTTYLASNIDDEAAKTFKSSLVDVLAKEELGTGRSRKHVARRVLEQLPEGLAENKILRADIAQAEKIKSRATKLAGYVTYVVKQEGATKRAPVPKTAPDGALIVRWETIGDYEFEDGMKLPAEVSDLNGKRVVLTGYMDALGEIENIREFVLTESLSGCCFGSAPNVNQLVLVDFKGAKGAAYSDEPVMVVGTLEVSEQREEEYVTSLYRLHATEVSPLPAQ